jgi:hypothetical protein
MAPPVTKMVAQYRARLVRGDRRRKLNVFSMRV